MVCLLNKQLEEFVKIYSSRYLMKMKNLNQFTISTEERNELKTGKPLIQLIERIAKLLKKQKHIKIF